MGNRIEFDITEEATTMLTLFVWQGFFSARPWGPADGDRYNGMTGAAEYVMQTTRYLRSSLRSWLQDNEIETYPGVFEYEVCEPYGRWLREQGPTLKERKARYEAGLRVVAFFERDKLSQLVTPRQ